MFKKKLLILSMVMMLSFVLVTACGGNKKEVDLGVTGSGTYTNDYFGVSLTFPTEWEYQDAAGMNELIDATKEVIAGDDAATKKKLSLAEAKTLNLLMASEFPLGGEQAGPSAMVIAEKVSLLQGIKSGKDYLEASKKFMIESQLPYEYEEITTAKVGDKDFAMMETAFYADEFSIIQNYYSAIIEGYAFNIILTYIDDETKAVTDNIIRSVTFK